MIEYYRRAARRCSSVNQFNALHIGLANRITPLELVALRQAQGPWFVARTLLQQVLRLLSPVSRLWGAQPPPAELRDRWLRKLLGLYAQAAKPRPEPYRRRRLSRHLRLYSAGGARQDKTLLICFVGSSQRPFLPVPVFLQHLDAALSDVLMVGYPRGKGHRHGLPELGSTLEETIDKLRKLAGIDAYRRCVALGTSGGGTPALLTALRLGLPGVLSAGGGSPTDPRWFAALGEDVGELARRYAAASSNPPRVVLAFGVDAQKDVIAAQAFAECVPAVLRPIRDRRHESPHNLFQTLLRRRRLQGFLEATVLQLPPQAGDLAR
jgi:hypothetical protein